MNKFATIGTAALLVIGTQIAQAQSTKFLVTDISYNKIVVTRDNKASATKSTTPLLIVRASVTYDASIATITLQGAYGSVSTLQTSGTSGSTGYIMGQYFGTAFSPLGVTPFIVKYYNQNGVVVKTDTLEITLK